MLPPTCSKPPLSCSGMDLVCRWYVHGATDLLHQWLSHAQQRHAIHSAAAAFMSAVCEIHCCKRHIGWG